MTENGARPDVRPTEPQAPPDHGIVFELCAESLEACRIAREGGAARIELCAELAVDGLTPSASLTEAAVRESGVPVFTLLRPRAGDFVYSAAEFATMRHDLEQARALGVSGFALGVLLPDGRVDIPRTRELVALAAPLEVTFHRAFDATPDLAAALEDVIATGCRRVLTSGGAPDVVAGADELAALVRQAAGRIAIAAGGGIRADNARALAASIGAQHFHGSLRYAGDTHRPAAATRGALSHVPEAPAPAPDAPFAGVGAEIDPHAIRRVVEELQLGAAGRYAAPGERPAVIRT